MSDDIGDLSFEAALAQLDTLIETLERGEVPLDEAVKAYERGMHLSGHCAKLLDQTEARITRLVQGEHEAHEEPFNVGDRAEAAPPRARRVSGDPGLFPGVSATRPRGATADVDPDEIPF